MNASDTVISATVTDNVPNGTNPQGLTDNISRVLNSPGMQRIRGAIGNVANALSAASSVDPREYHGRTFQPPQPQDDENKVNLVSDRLAGDPPRTPCGVPPTQPTPRGTGGQVSPNNPDNNGSLHAHKLVITPKDKPRSVSWKTPLEQVSGVTPDTSELSRKRDPLQEQHEALNSYAASLPVVSPETSKLAPKAMMKPPPPVEAGSLRISSAANVSLPTINLEEKDVRDKRPTTDGSTPKVPLAPDPFCATPQEETWKVVPKKRVRTRKGKKKSIRNNQKGGSSRSVHMITVIDASVWCNQVEHSSYSTKSPKSYLSQGATVFIDRDNHSV